MLPNVVGSLSWTQGIEGLSAKLQAMTLSRSIMCRQISQHFKAQT